MTNEADDDHIELIAATTRAMVAHLARLHGIPPGLVLAGVHAEVISIIATAYGGDVAAGCAERAADRVRNLPSYEQCELAAMQPMGRA